MTRLLFFFCSICFSIQLIAQAPSSFLSIFPDKMDATYQLGETANFLIESTSSGNVNYSIFYDEKTPVLTSGSIAVAANTPVVIPFTLNEPGVVLCKITKDGITQISAITFSPFDIPILEEAPIDFDAFWQTSKDQLGAVPLDTRLSLLSNNNHSTTYRVNLAQIDRRRVYGYITIPNGTGPFPAMMTLPSFGSVSNLVNPGIIVAEETGVIHMTISIHDAEPDANVSNAYLPNNINDPNQIYNKFAILAGVRAIDYLFTRPDFDGNNMGVMGVSQGAGLSTILAGLDDRINLLIHSNPTNCQLLGIKYDKASGFPYYLTTSATAVQENNVKYYEAAYFAQRYKGPSWTLISYEDLITPAAGSFAAFNQFSGPKILTHSIELNHNHPEEYWNDRYEFMRRYFLNIQGSNPFAGTSTGYFIDAGNDRMVAANSSVTLSGTVQLEDQINPNFPVVWSQLDGPGLVTFDTPDAYTTTANFSAEGTYTLQLLAEDRTQLTEDRQFFTLIDQVEIFVGDCTDEDNDGICAIEDCNDLDANLPAPIGSSCDDGNELTDNDIIQSDRCTCLGIIPCTDEDNDGICAEEDCDDNNPNLPASIGSSCDDANLNTSNDSIQADGCTCMGSEGGPANCSVITAVGGPSQITISNLVAEREEINIIGSNTNWQNVLVCEDDCTNTEVITGLNPGTYSIKINNYGDDGSYCYFTMEVEVMDGPCPDNDEDGVCASEDCDDNNPNLPIPVGSTCNDGDENTVDDVIQADGCTCSGLALCPNGDAPILPGTDCEDGDPNTVNDVILADGCTCEGSIPSTDPDCDDVQVAIQDNTMQITGITAPIAIIKVFNQNYTRDLLNCFNNCGTSQIITGLSPQTYHLDIAFYTSEWNIICSKKMDIDVSQFQSISSSRNRSIHIEELFKVYPNPTKDQIFLAIPKTWKENISNLAIINSLGQIVLRQNIASNSRSALPINLGNLNKGVYFLKVRQGGKRVFVEKIVVE